MEVTYGNQQEALYRLDKVIESCISEYQIESAIRYVRLACDRVSHHIDSSTWINRLRKREEQIQSDVRRING